MKINVFVILTLLCLACGKKQTAWESTWSIPILNDSLTLSNYYNDSTLVLGENNALNVELYRTLLDLNINDFIQIPDTVISQIFSPALNISNVPPGTEFVNEIQDNTLQLQDVELKRVILREGQILLTVFNPLNTGVIMTVELPGAVKQGQVFAQSFYLPSGSISNPSSSEMTLDLEGYELDLTGTGSMDFNVLQSKLTIQTDPNGETINISSNCDFQAKADVRNLKLDYAKGYFGSRIVDEMNSAMLVQLSNLTEGSMDFNLSQLSIEIENGFKCLFSTKVNSLANTNYNGNTVNLESSELDNEVLIPQAMNSWDNLAPSITTLEFDNSNSNMEVFLENLGAQLHYNYSIQINPMGNLSGGTDEIFSNSRIKVKVKLNTPLNIGIDGITLKDTFDISISQDSNKSHVNFAEFNLFATNSFPISASPLLYLMDVNGTILHTLVPDAQISSSLMGEVNVNSGLMEKESQVNFIFSEEMLADINTINRLVLELRFVTPNPTTGFNEFQSIPFGAKVKLKMQGNFNPTLVVP